VTKQLLEKLLYQMFLIRRFEERVLKLFEEGILFGTTHGYIGQEANAVGIINHLNKNDFIFSNHRCHGHYLTFTEDVEGLLSELMGKKTGVVAGRGGSQHLCNGHFYSNGIQAGLLPAAAGVSFVEKYKKTDNIVTVFIGDGTLSQGLTYEVFNWVSLWKLPLLVVIENNRYAQSTPIEKHLAGDIRKRAEAFDIHTTELSTFSVEEIFQEAERIIQYVRLQQKPTVLILNTYRFCSHSKSDDGRNSEEVKRWLVNDPIKLLVEKIEPNTVKEIEEKIDHRIKVAEDFSRRAEFPTLDPLDLDQMMAI